MLRAGTPLEGVQLESTRTAPPPTSPAPAPPGPGTGSDLDQAPPLPCHGPAPPEQGLAKAPPIHRGPHTPLPSPHSCQPGEGEAPALGSWPPVLLGGFQIVSFQAPPYTHAHHQPSLRNGRHGHLSEGETDACLWSHAWEMMELASLPACGLPGDPRPHPTEPLSKVFPIGVLMPVGVPGKAGLTPHLQKRQLRLGQGHGAQGGPARRMHTKESPSWDLSTQAASAAQNPWGARRSVVFPSVPL